MVGGAVAADHVPRVGGHDVDRADSFDFEPVALSHETDSAR